MKPKFFFVRSLSILLMLGLTLISVILSLVMFFISASISGVNFPWMLFGDELLPLLLFIPALIFRNRFCAIAAIIVSFINIFLRMSAIIIFNNTFMPLEYSTLRLLLLHTDFQTLQAVMGKFFLCWMIPLAITITAAVIYCCQLVWKTAGKTSRKISRRSLVIFSVLLGLSLFSNLAFHIVRFRAPESFVTVRPLPLIVLNITRGTISDMYDMRQYTPIPLPPESRKMLENMQIIAPVNKTLTARKKDLFDRIIIIAAESLDYAYISANNPQMPPGITPNLDRLCAQYPSMKNYFCAAQPTSWGLTAILLSRLDFEKDKYILPVSIFSLAKERGFHALYFSAAPGRLSEDNTTYRAMFQPDIQFFREDFFSRYDCKVENQWGISDRTLYTNTLKELHNTPYDRFIAVISTIDTHPPYHNTLPPEENQELFDTPFLRALHSSDRELGNFLEKIMQDKKLYNDRTLIIVTADHTATHGENYTDRLDFMPERVPLILITPNKDIFRDLNTEKFASSIDLAPTLAHLIGAEVPQSFMGRDLFSQKNHAITRTMNNTLLIYSPQGMISINPYAPIPAEAPDNSESTVPADSTETVWRDYYCSFYGK